HESDGSSQRLIRRIRERQPAAPSAAGPHRERKVQVPGRSADRRIAVSPRRVHRERRSSGVVVQPLDSLVDYADADWMDSGPREPDQSRYRARLTWGEIGTEPPAVREGPVLASVRRETDPNPAGLLGI